MKYDIHQIVQQPLETNCYVIGTDKVCIVIDPGSESAMDDIAESVGKRDVLAVILTHLHFDHSGAAHNFDAPVYAHKDEFQQLDYHKLLTKHALGEELTLPEKIHELKDAMSFADIRFSVLHTPGHTKGGVCLLFSDFIVTGDTLFAGTHGRTDLGGDEKELLESLTKLAKLPSTLMVLPGHGPSTTIAQELSWLPKE